MRTKIGCELLALADVDRDDPIGDARLFQEDRDLVPVGRGPIVKIDHEVSVALNGFDPDAMTPVGRRIISRFAPHGPEELDH
jgi:hypothetical protein